MLDSDECSLLTAVIYNEQDALEFLKDPPEVDRLLPLTPNARAILSDVDLPMLSTLDLYTDYGHRRVIARARRMERKLWLALEKESLLSQASRESMWGALHQMMATTLRLWYTLRNVGGSFLLMEQRGWKRYDCLEDSHASLLSHLATHPPFKQTFWEFPYFTGLVRWVNKIICQIAAKKSVLILTGNSYGFPNIILHVKQLFPEIKIVTLRGSSGKWRDLGISLFNLLRVQVKNDRLFMANDRLLAVTAVPIASYTVKQRVINFLNLIDDPVLKKGVDVYYDFLVQNVSLTDGLNNAVEQYWTQLRPKMLIAHTLRWWVDAVMGEVAKNSNTPSILISHGSHPNSDNATAMNEHQFNSQGMLVSPLATQCVMQSPQAELGVAQYSPTSPTRRLRPIMWGYRNLPVRPKQTEIRYILHAGSYKTWTAYRPWIYETSDEFVHGLKLLILACQGLENTKLIIRIRSLWLESESSLEALKKLLPESDCYEIKTSGTFLDDLSRADLLVSFSSTTIEEALQARRPVLLWGGSLRYKHFIARESAPKVHDRSAVYAPSTKKELAPLLKAILDVHAGDHLKDSELKNYVWPENFPGLDDLLLEYLK